PIGDDLWWSVTTGQGDQGWVNSRFLASTEPVPDSELIRLAERFGANSPYGRSLEATLPITRRAEVAIGGISDPDVIPAEELLTAGGWSEQRSLSVGPSRDDRAQQSLVDFHQLESWDEADVEPNGAFADDADRQAADRYFGGLQSVVVTATGGDNPARRTFIYVEQTPGGPEVVGFLAEPGSDG
ncbi:MAG: hypothetical protein ACR2QK_16465, partial [Acidimicrobiales bacterium]